MTIEQQLEIHEAEQRHASEKMRELIATAYDATVDYELRYSAVMQITAAIWHRRQPYSRNEAEVTRHDEPTPGPRVKRFTNTLNALANVPSKEQPTRKARQKQTGTVREYAAQLLQDRRGLDYKTIQTMIRRKFPVITTKGPHFGKVPRTPIKELHQLASDLNGRGVVLPPRRRSQRPSRSIRGRLAAIEASDAFHSHKCAVCGTGFTPHPRAKSRALYCSKSCKVRACQLGDAVRKDRPRMAYG